MNQPDRIYGVMRIKAVDEDAREITGIASTIGSDRDGDVVDPSGAQFKLPIPLLWQHDSSQPIGQVGSAKVTTEGIEIKAKRALPTADMPSQMVARLNEAWASIKSGLVRGLSIGFRPVEYAFLDSGGIHFTKWDWHELSAVTIPANSEATITSIKSLDLSQRAASGIPLGKTKSPPGVSGTTKQPAPSGFFYAQTQRGNKVNVQEQIKALDDKRKELAAERIEIQTKAANEGRTKDAEERERFTTLNAEIDSIDSELVDLQVMAKDLAKSAKPVAGNSVADAAAARTPSTAQHISVKHNHAEKGLAMVNRPGFCGGSNL